MKFKISTQPLLLRIVSYLSRNHKYGNLKHVTEKRNKNSYNLVRYMFSTGIIVSITLVLT